jgi:ATP-dependent Zn protease
MSSSFRTVLFWVLMIALAAVLWQMANNSGPDKGHAQQMSYSDFMGNVDRGNIKSAELVESSATAEIHGELRDSAKDFTVTIPKEVIPDLTEKLRKQGATVDVREGEGTRPADKNTKVFTFFVPIIFLIAIWIYMMRVINKRRVQSQQGGPPGGALG